MWIKKWLSPEEKKPKWTYILDEIIPLNIAKAPMIDPESRLNWLKQSWHESEAATSKLSKRVRNMLKIARKHNITLEPLKFSRETKERETLWHNRYMSNANYQWNKQSSRCIRVNHKVSTIKDICGDSLRTGYKSGPACDDMITRLVNLIPEIINPMMGTPSRIRNKNLDLTPKRIKKNESNNNSKTFNPDITARGNVLEQVRILGDSKGTKIRGRKIIPKLPAYRKISYQIERKTKAKIVMLVQNKGKASETTKVYIKMNDQTKNKIKFKLKKEDQSVDKAYVMAILWILMKDKSNKLKILTNDLKLVKWIGKGINEAEDSDWLGIKESTLWKPTLNRLRRRNNKIKIKTPSEKDDKKMEKMKRKLKESNPLTIEAKIKTSEKYLNKGAKLSNLAQKMAYKLVLRKKAENPGGPETWRRIKKVMKNLEDKWNIRVEEEKIWGDLENIENKKIRDFVWKMIHNKIRCGKFFTYIPNWQDKQFCECGQVESIEHILLECEDSKQDETWKEVKKTWKRITDSDMKDISIDDILAIGSIKIKDHKSGKTELTSEVLRTLIATAIWSIWKNRNERVFKGRKETKDQQVETWKAELAREIEMNQYYKPI